MKETSTVEKIIQVISTLAIEDMYFDKESKKDIFALANNEITTEGFLAKLNKKYNRRQVPSP